MTGIMQDFHRAVSFITTSVTAAAVCVLLALAIAYVWVSRVHRPQGFQRSKRGTLTTGAGMGIVWTVCIWYSVNQYSRSWDGYQLVSDFTMGTVVVAMLTVALVVILSTFIVVRAWKGSTQPYRASLILGSLTLVGASLSVAAACWSYYLPFDSAAEIFMNHMKINARDFAVVTGIAFVTTIIVTILVNRREIIAAFRIMRSIDAFHYMQLPKGELHVKTTNMVRLKLTRADAKARKDTP